MSNFDFGRKKEECMNGTGPRMHAVELAENAAAPPTLAMAAMLPPGGEAHARTRTAGTDFIQDRVLSQIDPATAIRMGPQALTERVNELVTKIASENRLLLNQSEQRNVSTIIVDDMIGLGPLEPLLQDETVSDIMINGPKKIYIERRGKLELTNYHFRNDAHVMHVAQRIASSIGRRVDESSPMLDARLADGSRVNVIIAPLSLKGPCISIRKFSKQMLTFDRFIGLGTLSPELSRALEIAARCRLNIMISGGTGSGKTTMMNALSRLIDRDERIITIEDAAELQLQQPHVLSLEVRPPNIEGHGEITQRDLVRNALRMRPDRIIIGEVRGSEAFDMMQAMNTGHSGSMSTIHANSARDALARIENMVLLANANLPMRAIRTQIASALDVVIQTERMRDGVRRVTEVAEIVGMEGDVISLGSLFVYRYDGESPDGTLRGHFERHGSRPRFLQRLEYYGLGRAFLEALGTKSEPANAP
jgi:pilus assembly protein CpaF